MSIRYPRYCGLTRPNDPYHYVLRVTSPATFATQASKNGRIPAPRSVKLKNGSHVAQWARTVKSKVTGFNPARDCKGNFMSYRYQPNNNCYNYACNIATNSFAQPGRRHGQSLFAANHRLTASSVIAAARADGLIELGGVELKLADVLRILRKRRLQRADGHLVALLISEADSKIRWKGDFHWVRCDTPQGRLWSQKNGRDQITNFDFSGSVIRDPSVANWTVNQGPRHRGRALAKSRVFAIQTVYQLKAWMFVPFGRTSII